MVIPVFPSDFLNMLKLTPNPEGAMLQERACALAYPQSGCRVLSILLTLALPGISMQSCLRAPRLLAGFDHVYGIPEHAASHALKTTSQLGGAAGQGLTFGVRSMVLGSGAHLQGQKHTLKMLFLQAWGYCTRLDWMGTPYQKRQLRCAVANAHMYEVQV